jgi:hypothetical protein
MTSDESVDIKRLRRESAELKRANEIVRATGHLKRTVLSGQSGAGGKHTDPRKVR